MEHDVTTEWLLRRLGGREAVMLLTGVTRQNIRHWHRTGVPYRYWPVLRAAAKAGGIDGITDTALASTRRGGVR